MQFDEVKDIMINILQETAGRFLLPYQVFENIKKRDPSLAKRIGAAYPVTPGNPTMSAGAGIYYSPASFIAHASEYFSKSNPNIVKEWIDPTDLRIEEVVPGNQEGISIWKWR